MSGELPEVTIFPDPAAFRAWLEAHHDTVSELWIGYYKKGVAKTAMTYLEAVDEALCFGWIDGLTKRIDDEVTANRYTPRRRTSNWSAVNIGKVARLREAGRMHPAGIRAFEERDKRRDASYSYERGAIPFDATFAAALGRDTAATERWERETPSFRRLSADWVMSAKRQETRDRRFEQLTEALRAGTRPRPFLVTRDERTGAG